MSLFVVFAFAQGLRDARMLLDSFLEQFDLSVALAECCDGKREQYKVVGQVYEGLVTLDIAGLNAPQIHGVIFLSVKHDQQHHSIANNFACSIDLCRKDTSRKDIGFGLGYEESARLMQSIATYQIQLARICDTERASLDRQEVQQVDCEYLTVADVDIRWDCAMQAQQAVHLDSAFGIAKRSLVEKAQVKISRVCVQSEQGNLQAKFEEICVAVALAHKTSLRCANVRLNARSAALVGSSKRRAMNVMTQSHPIEFVRVEDSCRFDITQTLVPRQMHKRHLLKRLRTGHVTNNHVASIAINNATQGSPGNELYKLREKRPACEACGKTHEGQSLRKHRIRKSLHSSPNKIRPAF